MAHLHKLLRLSSLCGKGSDAGDRENAVGEAVPPASRPVPAVELPTPGYPGSYLGGLGGEVVEQAPFPPAGSQTISSNTVLWDICNSPAPSNPAAALRGLTESGPKHEGARMIIWYQGSNTCT